MKKEDYLNNIERLAANEIVKGILLKVVSFEEFRNTGAFDYDKQKEVKALLTVEDDEMYEKSKTLQQLKDYVEVFASGFGKHFNQASEKILEMEKEKAMAEQRRKESEEIIAKVEADINQYTVGEIKEKLSTEDLNRLCDKLKIDVALIEKFTPPTLTFTNIPEKGKDIPKGYTDVFFWGVPASGKTCALSAILSTIKKNYTMENPVKTFGNIYRTNLVNIFRNEYGFLPNATAVDRTQYMPFLFYKRGEKKKRKISFFELSGEVFKNFNNVVNDADVNEERETEVNKTFGLIELLLKSDNRKIHYFFIDYNKEKAGGSLDNNFTQEDYLNAAADYFKVKNNIFKKNTDAVCVVITKADEIEGCDPQQQLDNGKEFLYDKFGNFMEILRSQCEANDIGWDIKLFSIGDVYFKRICNINRHYSTKIIEDLLELVPAVRSSWRDILNS